MPIELKRRESKRNEKKCFLWIMVVGVLLSGCGKSENSDIDTFKGTWVNEDGWKIEFYEPEQNETGGDLELTNWNGYDDTRLGSYECNESSQRLTIVYPDHWNIESKEDVYTYEFIDDKTLVLHPDGSEDESVEYTKTE